MPQKERRIRELIKEGKSAEYIIGNVPCDRSHYFRVLKKIKEEEKQSPRREEAQNSQSLQKDTGDTNRLNPEANTDSDAPDLGDKGFDYENWRCECLYGTYLRDKQKVHCKCPYKPIRAWLRPNRLVEPIVCQRCYQGVTYGTYGSVRAWQVKRGQEPNLIHNSQSLNPASTMTLEKSKVRQKEDSTQTTAYPSIFKLCLEEKQSVREALLYLIDTWPMVRSMDQVKEAQAYVERHADSSICEALILLDNLFWLERYARSFGKGIPLAWRGFVNVVQYSSLYDGKYSIKQLCDKLGIDLPRK